ncbi:MAG: DUF418 domain-containing protein [Bacteroidia bacterium]
MTEKSRRIIEIDALRGFALFGILAVNIFVFHAPYAHYGEFYGSVEGFEIVLQDALLNLFGNKSMLVYAMLFGVGFYLQSRQFSMAVFKPYWNRRMAILALFGVVHVFVFWFGDILLPYALLGLLLPFITGLRNRAQLTLALILFLMHPIYVALSIALELPQIGMNSDRDLATFLMVFSSGNYFEIFELRMHEYWSFGNEKLVIYLPKELGGFILGFQLAKHDFIGFIKTKIRAWLLVLSSIVLVVWYSYNLKFFGLFDMETMPFIRPLLLALVYAMDILHALTWVSLVVYCFKFKLGRWLLSALAKPGKMSLSNYLMQSFICVLIFYGFGLGLYGSMHASELLALAIGIYLFQFAFSSWWLRRFKQGPLEKLWRNLSAKAKLRQRTI